jgi:hypothetical protein
MKIVLLMLIMAISGCAQGKLKIDAQIYGPILDRSLETLAVDLDKANIKGKEIVLLINSPGGYLDVTNNIITFMKIMKEKHGFTFTCHLVLGASGAASIYANCDKRIAYINSRWEQHQAGNAKTGHCLTTCMIYDLFRLEAEAKIFKLNPVKYREMLPSLKSKRYLTISGKNVYNNGIANKYVNKYLMEKK